MPILVRTKIDDLKWPWTT